MTTITSSSRPTNRPNPAFERALRFLASPLSLGALGLILINDQVLRRWWPSWVTGKLSDFAWLFVVPLVLAALMSWILPKRRSHTAWTFGLAYALTGLGFILVKTVLPVNLLVGRAWMAATGLRPALSPDLSDLLALPGLLLSLIFCLRGLQSDQNLPAHRFARWRLAVLPLAALVLLADAPAPDFGIQCFSREGNSIYAKSGYSSMVSSDGGLTWTYDNRPVDCASKSTSGAGAWQEAPGPRDGQVYRFQSGNGIQLSTDGGKTWQTVYQVGAVSEAERMYVMKSRQGSPAYDPGPLDAAADPATGNMLFAMGQQGVLVRNASGAWVRADAGAYKPLAGFPNTDAFVLLIGSTALLAVGLALLTAASLAMRWTAHWLRWVVLAIAWIGWATLDVLFPPAISASYILTVTTLGMLATGLFILPLVTEQIIRLTRRAPRAILPLLGFGLAGGLLYLMPYVLWVYNVIPAFSTATGVALALGVIVLAAGVVWVRARGRKTVEAQAA